MMSTYEQIKSSVPVVPAVRCLRLMGWVCREEDGSCHASDIDIDPVLYFLHRETITWHVKDGKDHDSHHHYFPGVKAMRELNAKISWRGTQAIYVVSPRFFEYQDDQVTTTEEDERGDYAVIRVVPCPWPAEQDEEKLRSYIEDVKKELNEKVEQRKANIAC